MKRLIVFALVVGLILVFPVAAMAKTTYSTVKTTVKTTPTPASSATPVANVDSFELFWPVVPGKTMGDTLYGLKIFKEKVRGFLIFGIPQKANYKVTLATKRVVEAEKLITDGKTDLANQTLDAFDADIVAGSDLWATAKSDGNAPVAIEDDLRKELQNLEVFLRWYSPKNQGETKVKIDTTLPKVSQFIISL